MGIQTRVLRRTGGPVTVLGYGAMELCGRSPTPGLSDQDVGGHLYEQARRLLPAAAAQPAEG
jgi:hypothetical protein